MFPLCLFFNNAWYVYMHASLIHSSTLVNESMHTSTLTKVKLNRLITYPNIKAKIWRYTVKHISGDVASKAIKIL
jgi:hypothetical protein